MTNIIVTTLAMSGLLIGCGNKGSINSSTSPSILPQSSVPPLSINEMTAVPVINGANTAGKIYIHNRSNHTISDIKISLQSPTVTDKLNRLLSTMGIHLNSSRG